MTSSFSSGTCVLIASPSWLPTVSTGLSEVIGSWKFIATSLPRTRRSSFFFSFSRSRPLNIAVPLTIRPGGWGIRPSSASVETLLPEPDSPTIPSVSPGKSSYETPSTAWTIPSSVLNSTTRSLIARSGSGTHPPLLGIERVPEAVADEVDAKDDGHDRQAWEDRQPPRGLPGKRRRVCLGVVDEHAEGRSRRLDPEPEEGERRLHQDRRADGERGVADDRAEGVRKDVPEHQTRVAGSGGLRRLDVLLMAQGEVDDSDDAGGRRPEEEDQDERDAPLAALPEQSRRGEQDGEEGQRQHEVCEAHQKVVHPAAEEAGDRTDDQTDPRREERDEDADLHGGTDAPEDAGVLVAPQCVRAEVVRVRRALEDVVEVDLGVPVRRDEVGEDPGAEDDHQTEHSEQ